jgi:hypothetical protein
MTCLKTPEQAADFLQCSPKQVHAHAKSQGPSCFLHSHLRCFLYAFGLMLRSQR